MPIVCCTNYIFCMAIEQMFNDTDKVVDMKDFWSKLTEFAQVPKRQSTVARSQGLRGEAVIDEEIQPGREGRVRFRGSFWPARCEQPIVLTPGQLVVVRGVGKGTITLVEEPLQPNLASL
jgi:membrane-bound ClpP family serine protease